LSVYLVEKGVVFRGKSKIVVHHMVVRDRIVRETYKPGVPVAFDIDLTSRTEGSMLRIPLDPREMAVVAVLHGSTGKRVFQSAFGEPQR